jgi:hypothetical protein
MKHVDNMTYVTVTIKYGLYPPFPLGVNGKNVMKTSVGGYITAWVRIAKGQQL